MDVKINNTWQVYIIGHIPDTMTLNCKRNFARAQNFLESKGFKAINPLDIFDQANLRSSDKKRHNLRRLVESNAVFLLSDIAINVKRSRNTELKIAKDLNLIIIHEPDRSEVSYKE